MDISALFPGGDGVAHEAAPSVIATKSNRQVALTRYEYTDLHPICKRSFGGALNIFRPLFLRFIMRMVWNGKLVLWVGVCIVLPRIFAPTAIARTIPQVNF